MPAERFLDTNILLYGYDLDSPAKRTVAQALLERAGLEPGSRWEGLAGAGEGGRARPQRAAVRGRHEAVQPVDEEPQEGQQTRDLRVPGQATLRHSRHPPVDRMPPQKLTSLEVKTAKVRGRSARTLMAWHALLNVDRL